MHGYTAADEMAILRRFEPVVRYTRGERFFPMDVERYISQSSLWVKRQNEPAELLIPQGEMTFEKLVEPRAEGFGSIYFLKFIEPPDILELARYSFNEVVKSLTHPGQVDIFRAGRGRLARVGYASRFIDALFSVTLLMRGRLPGDSAAASALVYRRLQEQTETYTYYGRVVRQGGWVALQYWFFYAYNNWRTGFFGANDHEGDWEMTCIFCSEAPEAGAGQPAECRLTPEWVAYATHESSGDDLRRRWDDPEVEKIDNHPIVYAGAGSHASYFTAGEYLAELELAFLSPVVKLVDRVRSVWTNWLRQGTNGGEPPGFNVFRVPFVDYARGDGLSIGPNQARAWQPCRLDEQVPWAVAYRGLWGMYAQDPVSRENAPAGPVYNRDGQVRRSWYDPVGWAGLDKVPPQQEALALLQRQFKATQVHRIELEREIDEKSAALTGLGVEAAAMADLPHLKGTYMGYVEKIGALSKELAGLRKQLTEDESKLEAFGSYEQRLLHGARGPLRGHIRRALRPSPQVNLRLGGLAEVFAAVSIGMMMTSIVLLTLFGRRYLLVGLAATLGVLIFVEAGFRRQLARLINSLVVGLAIICSLVLLVEFFWQIVVVAILGAGLYIMWENLREIRN